MSKISLFLENLRPHFSEGVYIIIWFFLIASAVIFVLHSLLSVSFPYSLDYGEAPLIDQAMRLSAGQNIYRSDLATPPYTIANYPPLYVLSLIPFLNWFDSPFPMARVVSVMATLCSAIFIALTVKSLSKAASDRLVIPGEGPTRLQRMARTLNVNLFPALIAALFFLASPYVVQWSGRARIDSLALAFATAALFVLARWPRARWSWAVAGLLLVAAAYTRQSYALAAPFAAFVWLWVHNKRRALGLALLVGGLGLALFLLLNLITHGGFYYNIVTANVNEFGWDRLKDNLTRLWDDSYIILLLAILFLLLGWRGSKEWADKNPWFLLAPFLVGAFLSGLTIGKIGSNINYFLELAAALALIAGISVVWTRSHPWRHAAVILLLSFQFGLLLESSMLNNVDWILSPRRADFTYLQFLEQEVKHMDDPVLADEYMGMLTMNDRPLYLQPFEVTQLANAGMWNQQPLLDEMAAQKFNGILIYHYGTWPVFRERWTPEMLAAIDEFYRPVKTLAGTVVYIPREPTEISRVPEPSSNSSPAAAPVWSGQPIPLGASDFVSEPFIAINPANPQQLAAVATRVSKQDCELPNCKVQLVLFTSLDGGATWQERAAFGQPPQMMYQGLVAFDPTGALDLMGIRNSSVVLKQTSLEDEKLISQAGFEDVTNAQVQARPWLRLQPETGELFLTLDAQENDQLYVTPSLKRSTDGVNWSTTARADQHISAADIFTPRATGPSDIQVLFGEGQNVSLVWVWNAEPWTWPRTVWMANSTDGGETFGEPTPILKTWGPINTASANGDFAIAYRVGDETNQQLAVATSADNGQTWSSTIASGDVPLYFDPDHGPGLGMAPDGTIDLVFYAQTAASPDCVLNLDAWRETLGSGRVDSCEYDVYYTYSQDSDRSFANPVRLNSQPIRGDDFTRFNGASQVGSHLVVASGEDYAYPVWVGTPGVGRTQIYMAKMER
ncbi:MAG: hypothetical protein ACK2T5_09125 [Anaerolineales bacterium]